MVKISTHNIEISVEAKYWSQHSMPRENHYFFVYFITIENKSDFSVQLLRRHWDIFDSVGDRRAVDGEGVVGETPVLEPGQKFKYNSGCNLQSDMGYMKGHYTFMKLMDSKEFNVNIPVFDLIVPAKLN
ncbi:MAG: Co2+/Mg2+ efflux protein ApaG [Bacteroidia bacterium]|nr:Co2+/Mg2+ efflux protein ApaG [Bacteroidia bacterium]